MRRMVAAKPGIPGARSAAAMRTGRTDFGIAERLCWRCQRIMTWAGVLPWAAAMAVMAGSSNVLVPVPR